MRAKIEIFAEKVAQHLNIYPKDEEVFDSSRYKRILIIDKCSQMLHSEF